MPHDSNEPLKHLTPRAQQVLALSRLEADRFNHNFVGTEHLLLGLIRLGQGTAVNVLTRMGLDLEAVRTQVEGQVGTGPDQKAAGNIPYTPRVRKVLDLAATEAKALSHTYVGTEHILLGILREGDGVAARVLRNLGVDTELTRQNVLREVDPNYKTGKDKDGLAPASVPSRPFPAAIDLSKRYDLYCEERDQEIQYKNVLFKGIRKLFERESEAEHDIFYEFVEIEQEGGQTIFIARSSILKFKEHSEPPAASG